MPNTPEAASSATGIIDVIISNRFWGGKSAVPLRIRRAGRIYLLKVDLVVSALPDTPLGNHGVHASWRYCSEYKGAPWISPWPDIHSMPDCRVFHDATVGHPMFSEGSILSERRMETMEIHAETILFTLDLRVLTSAPVRVTGPISVRVA